MSAMTMLRLWNLWPPKRGTRIKTCQRGVFPPSARRIPISATTCQTSHSGRGLRQRNRPRRATAATSGMSPT